MPTREQMVATVEAYVRAFEKDDVEAICALYAEDATVQDPVGTPPRVGAKAVRSFYSQIIAEGGGRLELRGPICTTARTAAFPFSVRMTRKGITMHVDVIDVLEFDESGKVKSMAAHWGPDNTRQIG
jgi:steroid Delta-isomerase